MRDDSSSRALARTLVAHIGDRAVCETADIGQLPHYNADLKDDQAVAAFIEAVGKADGIVFVTTEFN